ncbi:hypothetical protein EFB08_17775 [Rufibacter latericius]|uniref:Uncharacterized protein n=1 Tax=Rufibacter latericius TaxID=2487040 RepID=A0A3M9MDW7_9BACT|nr:hypothetical protein EFB08_17775 [Rufibacter latericius]
MDWVKFILGMALFLTGFLLILIKATYFKIKNGDWLYTGNIKMIFGIILSLTFGLFMMISAF